MYQVLKLTNEFIDKIMRRILYYILHPSEFDLVFLILFALMTMKSAVKGRCCYIDVGVCMFTAACSYFEKCNCIIYIFSFSSSSPSYQCEIFLTETMRVLTVF